MNFGLRVFLLSHKQLPNLYSILVQSGANIGALLQCYLRVVSTDMAYTFLLYFICIECTAFHEFTAICSVVVVLLSGAFTFVHSRQPADEAAMKKKHWMLLGCKLANVTLTILAFMSLFIADMYFDIAEDLKEYAEANNLPL